VKIILIRHGPPNFNHNQIVTSDNVKRLLDAYAASNVTTVCGDRFLNSLSKQNPVALTSELPRAIDTAKQLELSPVITSHLLNESELPYPNKLFVKLPWRIFLVIYRIAWYFGYRKNVAGKLADIARSKAGADLIEQHLTGDRPVVVIGHGIMLRLIKQQLSARGWIKETESGSGYWSITALSRHPKPQ